MTNRLRLPLNRLLLALLLGAFLAGCDSAGHSAESPSHHLPGGGFRNLPQSPPTGPWWRKLPFIVQFPFQRADMSQLPADHRWSAPQVQAGLDRHAQGDSVTWIGHMTALVRMGGVTLLTDPWFSDHCSPLPPFGPRRVVPPALPVENLPRIDLLLISHSHYDHFDTATLRQLARRQNPLVIVPLGLGELVREQGLTQVVELDWHQSSEFSGLRITALPVIHWSKRTLFKTNDTLWAGFSIVSATGKRLYFGGDAEYGPHYRQLGEQYGPFDLALLSIGAFLPREVMAGHHCEPADCLRLGLDLRARRMAAMHWGTVQLGFDGLMEAPTRFRAAATQQGVAAERIWIPHIGETQPF